MMTKKGEREGGTEGLTPGGAAGSVNSPTPIRGKATTVGATSSLSKEVSKRFRRRRMLLSTRRRSVA